MKQILAYIEVDQNYCGLVYGTAPCSAAVGVTGDSKCYNTVKTCQDPDNFSSEPVTLRFGIDTDYLPREIECLPTITDWSVSPSIISLGEDLGLRAELRVTLKDHPWPDTGPGGDKYIADRTYDPMTQGTFWGKWRARVRFLRGQPMRLIIGEVGQALEDMETRHFIVETVDGPSANGMVTITGKDPLKLLDGDRAQAPAPSLGFLLADLTDSETTATLAPAGVGNGEYPTSGWVNIGGAEICAFTRVGDVLTLTRAQFNTEAQEHDAEDRVQLVLRYTGADPADIIYDLMTVYGEVPEDFINLPDWQEETGAYLRRVYSAIIPEPTPVKKLVSEIIEQAALSIWWDEVRQLINLRVLRSIATDAALLDPDVILQGSFSSKEQPNKRISQVWLYYGQRNPVKRLEEEDNFRSLAITADTDAEANYGSAAIKKIYSRWIPAFGRTVATRVGDILLGRYKDPPRRFTLSLLRGTLDVQAGQGYRVAWWNIQDEEGAPTNAPMQVTRFDPQAAQIGIEAEEQLFVQIDPEDLTNRTITIDANTYCFNLREAHDALYPLPATPGDGETLTVRCIIETGVTVGSNRLGVPAFDVGTWPSGIDIEIINRGRIQGRGGKGGNGHSQSSAGGADVVLPQSGEPGGLALLVDYPVEFDNTDGKIEGGGGGGGGGGMSSYASNRESGGGGGGQGYAVGAGGLVYGEKATAGTPGTQDAPGTGGVGTNGSRNRGGNGGARAAPGQAGTAISSGFPGGSGGAAGGAIDGDSNITFTDEGEIVGTRIN